MRRLLHGVHSDSRLLAREIVYPFSVHIPRSEYYDTQLRNVREAEATFYRMPVAHFPAMRLCLQLLKLMVTPLQLLYQLVVIIYGGAELLLSAILTDNILIQVLFQRLRYNPGGSHE
jgi:hypothetical protein